VQRQNEVLAAAVDLLGPRVIAAQAKNVVASGYSAAGAGLLDYPAVLAQLGRCPPVPLVAQDVEEHDAARMSVHDHSFCLRPVGAYAVCVCRFSRSCSPASRAGREVARRLIT